MPDQTPTPHDNHSALWELTDKVANMSDRQDDMAKLLKELMEDRERDQRDNREALNALVLEMRGFGMRLLLVFLIFVVGGALTWLLCIGVLKEIYYVGFIAAMLTPFFGEGAVKLAMAQAHSAGQSADRKGG
jgi:hypothetical protein